MVSTSPQETYDIGQRIATKLKPGSIVSLNGELGSGKTCLARGIALGLGIKENITSPTYTIINEYESPTLYHIDAYRLNNDEDFNDIGGQEIINSNGISIIEWGQRIPKSIPENSITVFMEITELNFRLIRIKGLNEL
jgi:tRNA threonylcarbamoyladenosine biosynthesis protein TsaE